MKYFLDTNTIIYYLKGMYPSLLNHFQSVPAQSIAIPSIVMAEIEYGARKSTDYEKTISKYKQFTDFFHKADFSDQCSEIYGRIRSTLEKRGELIGPNDMMIAATVLADNGILITHNTREFRRVPDLNIEDWTE